MKNETYDLRRVLVDHKIAHFPVFLVHAQAVLQTVSIRNSAASKADGFCQLLHAGLYAHRGLDTRAFFITRGGAFRETGALRFFLSRGAHLLTTSSPQAPYPLPTPSGRSRSFRCSSSPRKVSGLYGAPGDDIAALRQPRALRGGCGSCGSLQPMPLRLRSWSSLSVRRDRCAVQLCCDP